MNPLRAPDPAGEQPSSGFEIAPPVGQVAREGWNSHRGYAYQVWISIYQWLVLGTNEVLFLEYAEDTARTSVDTVDVAQVRLVAASISLNTAPARAALGNFWAHVAANPDRTLSFQYITTGEIALEQGGPFDASEPGIALWEKAKTDIQAATKIHEYLKSKASQLTPALATFLTTADSHAVQEKLIRPFSWNSNFLSENQLESEVEERIYACCHSMGMRLAQDQILAVKRALFTFATRASTTENYRKLTQRQLTELIVDATSVRMPLPDLQRLIQSAGSVNARPSSPPPVIDWITPSQALESWPKTLGNGHEIARPELTTIETKIVETERSAHLLLGEPGSGKSALLAKLSVSLTAKGIKHLSIKADLVPKGIKSLDELVTGLGEGTLVDAIERVAAAEKFVVLIDQLDAVCSLIDQHTDRLNLLVTFLQRLARIKKIHIVTSCRPFEFTTDSRLQELELHSTKITLTLPAWESISALVLGADNQATSIADSTKEVLRNPWHLKLFLDLPHPRPVLSSFYDLVNHIWNQKVLRAGAPANCSKLVDLIANTISKNEEFWLPDAVADAYPEAKNYLTAEGILKQTDDLRSIGFRHQTFYDYFLLRTFLHQQTSLVEYVKGHDQSFFVRPTIVRALVFLRASNRTEYVRTITDMINGGYLRSHLRLLLSEFIGQQAEPITEEIHYMLPLLQNEIQGQRVLRIVSGSPGWFKAILTTDFEERWMRADFPKVAHTLSLLTAAITFDERTVVDLIARNWRDKPDHDRIAFNVLSGAKLWEPQLVDCVMEYAKRRGLDDMSWLLRPLLKTAPARACEIIGATLRKEAADFAAEVTQGNAATPPPASTTRRRRRRDDDSVQERIKELLEGDNLGHIGICKIAESQPELFLEQAWKPIRDMLLLAGNEQGESNPTEYLHDYVEFNANRFIEHPDDLLCSVARALQALAISDPSALLDWIEREQRSELVSVHRMIALGMLSLPLSCANAVIRYLSADRRRLSLGSVTDELADAKALLQKFAPKCSRGPLFYLVDQITQLPKTDLLRWKGRNGYSPWNVARWSRSERHQLLSCIPLARFGRKMRKLMRCEGNFFGGRVPFRRGLGGQGGFVGAPVTEQEMEAMSDDAITALFNRYNDRVDTNHELRGIDIARSGGVRQQSAVFGRFAVDHPERAKLQIPRLRPGDHEHYAARLISSLADPRPPNTNANISLFPAVLPTAEIEALIRDFDSRGFASPEFRETVAQTLQHICKTQEGLAAPTIQMLVGWLPQIEEQIREPEVPQTPKSSILFNHDTWWTSAQGRATVAEAIIFGLLTRKPSAVDECLSFVLGLGQTEKEHLIWGGILYRLPYLFGFHSEKLTILFTKLFKELPGLFSLTPTAVALSSVSGRTTPVDAEKEWFDLLLTKPEPYYRQLAGELAFIHCGRKGSVWSKDLIERGIKDEFGEYFFRGLVYAAGSCVSYPPLHQLVENILMPALSSANSVISNAAMMLTYHLEREGWGETPRRLVLKFVRGDTSDSRSPDVLCGKLEEIIDLDPETCLTVSEILVEKYKTRLADITTSLPFAAEHIINMALTVQRFLPFRDRGLILFENLLEMNIAEARKAADLLNERPAN